MRRALRPSTPGDFLPDEKVTKESPRGESPSGYSPWGALSSPQRRQAPLPPEKGGTPGSTQATQPPAEPRISSRKCDPRCSLGKKKTDLPTSSKWQIGLLLWLKVARRETERSAASTKRAAATHRGIPKGAALGAPLVTFPASGKSPGCRAERLHQGSLGLPAPQKPPGRGAERPPRGRQLAPARNQCANWVQAQPALGLIFFIE